MERRIVGGQGGRSRCPCRRNRRSPPADRPPADRGPGRPSDGKSPSRSRSDGYVRSGRGPGGASRAALMFYRGSKLRKQPVGEGSRGQPRPIPALPAAHTRSICYAKRKIGRKRASRQQGGRPHSRRHPPRSFASVPTASLHARRPHRSSRRPAPAFPTATRAPRRQRRTRRRCGPRPGRRSAKCPSPGSTGHTSRPSSYRRRTGRGWGCRCCR